MTCVHKVTLSSTSWLATSTGSTCVLSLALYILKTAARQLLKRTAVQDSPTSHFSRTTQYPAHTRSNPSHISLLPPSGQFQQHSPAAVFGAGSAGGPAAAAAAAGRRSSRPAAAADYGAHSQPLRRSAALQKPGGGETKHGVAVG